MKGKKTCVVAEPAVPEALPLALQSASRLLVF
jgi:hypothetical protein